MHAGMEEISKIKTKTGRDARDLPYVQAWESLTAWFGQNGWALPKLGWAAAESGNMYAMPQSKEVTADPEFDVDAWHFRLRGLFQEKLSGSPAARAALDPAAEVWAQADRIAAEYVLLHECAHSESASYGPALPGENAGADLMASYLEEAGAQGRGARGSARLAHDFSVARREAYADVMALWMIRAKYGKDVALALNGAVKEMRSRAKDPSHATAWSLEEMESWDPAGKSYKELSAKARELADGNVVFLLTESGLHETQARRAAKDSVEVPMGCGSLDLGWYRKLRSADSMACKDSRPLMGKERKAP